MPFTFDIWSVGDYHFLANTLNSVAAWAGTGSPERIASIGLLISFFIMAVQGLMRGGQMPQYQNVLLGWFFYAFLFGPGVTVIVKDTYSVNVEVVDNVPLGLAATGSIISNLTYNITDELKQALSLPTMVDDVFGGALKILSDSRSLAFPTNSDQINRSIINYISDCTNIGILRGDLNVEEILTNESDPVKAIKWYSNVYTTKVYLGDPNPPSVTCTEAYNSISGYLTNYSFWAEWDLYLESKYDIVAPSGKIQQVFDAISTSSASAKDFMLASAMYEMFRTAQQTGNMTIADPALASAISDTLAARDMQSASEAQFFKRIARPGMAFFEAMTYTVAPFMAFLVVLVPLGISLVAKYFMLNVWVQLWMPSMAILNYMGNYVLQGKIDAIATKGPVTSMLQAQEIFMSTQDWMSTINSLAAMVPLVTLFLVSGSMMVGSAFASKLGGADHFDEKKLSPDTLKNDPVLTNKQGSFTNTIAGREQIGAPTVEFSTSAVRSAVVSSATDEALQTSKGMYSELAKNAAWSNSATVSSADIANYSQSTAMNQTQSGSFLREKAGSILKGFGLQEASADKLAAALAIDAGVGLQAGGSGLGGKATQSVMNEFMQGSGKKVDVASNEAFRLSDSEQIDLAKRTAADISSNKGTAFTGSNSIGGSEALRDQASQVSSAAETYRRALNSQESIGGKKDTSAKEVGGLLARTEAGRSAIQDVVSKHGLGAQAGMLASEYQTAFGSSAAEASARGGVHALYNAAMSSGSASMFNDLSRLTGLAFNSASPQINGSASQNQGVSGGAAEMAVPTSFKSQGAQQAQSTVAAAEVKHNAGSPPGAGAVEAQYGVAKGQFDKQAMTGQLGMANQQVEAAQHQLNQGRNFNTAADGVRNVSANIQNSVATLGLAFEMGVAATAGAIDGGSKAAYEAFNQKASTLVEQANKNPQDESLWDRFVEAKNEFLSNSFLGRADKAASAGLAGAADGALEAVSGVKERWMSDYRSEAEHFGVTGDAAELYARARFHQVAGGGLNDLIESLPPMGFLTEQVIGRLEGPAPDAGLNVDSNIKSAIIESAENFDRGLLSNIGTYQQAVDTRDGLMAQIGGSDQPYAWTPRPSSPAPSSAENHALLSQEGANKPKLKTPRQAGTLN